MVVDGTRLLTDSQAVVLRLPRGMVVWNRPLAVTVIRNGVGQRVQVRRPIAQVVNKVLAAGQPNVVFSTPVISGPYTIITACEVFVGGGFGFGSHSRPVAAVIIGPEGVKVQPIVDATRIALAMMGALGGITFTAMRLARRHVHRRH